MGVAGGMGLAASGLTAASWLAKGDQNATNQRQQGQSTFPQSLYSAEQAQLAAQMGELKATQTDTAMRNQMGEALANMEVVSANSGATGNSSSGFAVANRFEQLSTDARVTSTDNIRMQSEASANAAMLYEMSGMNALRIANGNARASSMEGMLLSGGSALEAATGLPGLNGFGTTGFGS